MHGSDDSCCCRDRRVAVLGCCCFCDAFLCRSRSRRCRFAAFGEHRQLIDDIGIVVVVRLIGDIGTRRLPLCTRCLPLQSCRFRRLQRFKYLRYVTRDARLFNIGSIDTGFAIGSTFTEPGSGTEKPDGL